MKELLSPAHLVQPAHSYLRYEPEEIEQSITDRFEKIAAWYPERIALKGQRVEVTYYALNEAANRVAHAILDHRANAKKPVGLLLKQEYLAITTILGVLKSGNFYMPLDPSHPPDWLSLMLRDCQIGTLATEAKYLSLAKQLTQGTCNVLCVDELDDSLSTENPDLKITAASIAAVFYTSGTTGRPKGVIQSHRNVLHRVMLSTNSLGIGVDDQCSLLSSLGYSASLRNLFSGLLNGATVHPFNVVDEGAARLADWMIRERLTIYFSVPTVFRQLAGNLTGREDFSSLRVIELAGESVTRSDVELYKEYFPSSCVLISTLGSNETGPIRQYVVDKTTDISDTIVPIGYSVEDKELLLVNDSDEDVGFNQIGEIVVRSGVLSPGYWRQPELTAATFQTDPKFPGKAIFRTGDLGLLLPNGCLLYKGRKDFRVKIRGKRVETGEIENALNSHPSVQEAVVVAREDKAGEQVLVAYVAPRQQAALTTTGMRRFLLNKLPDYMVPFLFVFLDGLPHTLNGKIDRHGLPQPHAIRAQIEGEFVAPQDALERDLATMCEVILGVHPIGTRDNLFDLGADSLTAVRLILQIEKALHKHIPPATLFRSPTVEQLATTLRQGKEPRIWSSLVSVQPTGSRLPFFWIHGDVSNVYLPKYLGPDQPLYGLDHQSQEGRAAVHTEVQTIAAYYLREVLTVQPKGPYFLGGYSFGGIVALEMAQQLKSTNEEVRFLALLDPAPLGSKGDAPRTHAPSLMDSLRHHIGRLPPNNKLDYIMSRIAARIRDRVRPLGKFWQKITWKTCLIVGLRMPPFVRSPYIRNVYSKALNHYIPQPYGGQTLLFQTKDRSNKWWLDWEKILQGGFESHELEGSHTQLRQASHVHLWAGKLRDSLLHAQTESMKFW